MAISRRSQRATRAPLIRLTAAQLAVATPAELAAYEQALRLEIASTSPLAFAQHVSPWFEAQPHLELLDDLIVRLVNDQIRSPVTGKVIRCLGVSMPPRHGKSELISTHTPAWIVTTYPDWRVILASYEASFAASWGKKARALVEAHPEFGVHLDQSSKAADKWDLAAPHRGGMVTAGVGGGVTGKGANVLIIDDPVKNADEARSEVFRQRNKDFFTSTGKTRLEPGGYIIVLQTRWHEDDLLGWLTSSQPDKWHYLNLPALAEDGETDPLGREPGEALCPAWYDEEALAEKAEDEEEGKWFPALYQGQPTTKGGGIFKEESWNTYHTSYPGGTVSGRLPGHYVLDDRYVLKADCTRFATVDLGATEKTSADFSVFAVWDVTPDRELILVAIVRKRIQSADHLAWTTENYRRFKPKYIIVESVTFGLTLMQHGVRQGLPVRAGKADKDKVSRAIPAGTLNDNGRLWIPRVADAPWITTFVHECQSFPNATHDDQVDVLAYAAQEVYTGALSTVSRRPWEESRTLEARLDRWVKRHEKQRKSRRHPELGKL